VIDGETVFGRPNAFLRGRIAGVLLKVSVALIIRRIHRRGGFFRIVAIP